MTKLIIGFTIGISLGAIFSWSDDSYANNIGYAWLALFALSIITAIITYQLETGEK